MFTVSTEHYSHFADVDRGPGSQAHWTDERRGGTHTDIGFVRFLPGSDELVAVREQVAVHREHEAVFP